EKKLFEYALLLGSDCPYFLLNKPAFATGRGEILEEINLSLSEYKILIVNPGIHISTKELFAEISPAIPAKHIREIILQPIQTWKNELTNDFEMIAFSKYPSLQKIKESMYDANAIYSSMTGTGSTIFGLFNADEKIDLVFEKEYFHKWIYPF
ncbi:MAG TPA: 4-(cytidine 5'-diphospho)-2-C-methyl-D-erythritol kinase, partial [Hanamia sp.]